MGKKNKKGDNYMIDLSAPERSHTVNGMVRLQWTEEGRKKMNTMRQKMSPKVFSAKEQEEVKRGYDPTDYSAVLDLVENAVKDGKYKKAIRNSEDKLLDAFIEEYKKLDKESLNWEQMNALAKKTIIIGKSFFEYCEDPALEFIDDKSYDGLLSKFLKEGGTEPMGIIPKGLKNQKKVPIKYETLHNNMDKAYALREGDKIPDGVKESDTIEKALKRMYKAAELETTTEIELEFSPKIDGVSMNATMDGTTIHDPQTRGDKDESIAVLGLENLMIAKDDLVDHPFGIQYEAFVTEYDRSVVSDNLNLPQPYVSCRHAASGIMHRLTTEDNDMLMGALHFYPINSENLEGTYIERMDMLENYGVVPANMPKRKCVKGDLEALLKEISKYYKKLEEVRGDLGFAIDGMVITVIDDDLQKKIGRNGRTNKYQIAYKFDPSTAHGSVKTIGLDTGKKGFRTIQVYLEHPVYLDGVQYDHVPVPTAEAFEKMELAVGDTVEIHRVGDVIPAMTVVDHIGKKKLKAPTKCPDCGKDLRISKKRYYCDNIECPGNIIGRFENFIDKMGLIGFGNSFSVALYDCGCRSLADILELDKEKIKKNYERGTGPTERLLEFPKILKHAISDKYDYQVLGAMGIPGIAEEKARKILDKNTLAGFKFTELNDGNVALNLAIAKDTWQDIEKFISSNVFKRDVEVLNNYITKTGLKTGGLRIGHTGGDFGDEVMDVIEMNNFEPTDGRSFDILVAVDKNGNSGKLKRANKKNLPVYTPEEFIKRYQVNLMDKDHMMEQMFNVGAIAAGLQGIAKSGIFTLVLQVLEAMARTAIAGIPNLKTDV